MSTKKVNYFNYFFEKIVDFITKKIYNERKKEERKKDEHNK